MSNWKPKADLITLIELEDRVQRDSRWRYFRNNGLIPAAVKRKERTGVGGWVYPPHTSRQLKRVLQLHGAKMPPSAIVLTLHCEGFETDALHLRRALLLHIDGLIDTAEMEIQRIIANQHLVGSPEEIRSEALRILGHRVSRIRSASAPSRIRGVTLQQREAAFVALLQISLTSRQSPEPEEESAITATIGARPKGELTIGDHTITPDIGPVTWTDLGEWINLSILRQTVLSSSDRELTESLTAAHRLAHGLAFLVRGLAVLWQRRQSPWRALSSIDGDLNATALIAASLINARRRGFGPAIDTVTLALADLANARELMLEIALRRLNPIDDRVVNATKPLIGTPKVHAEMGNKLLAAGPQLIRFRVGRPVKW